MTTQVTLPQLGESVDSGTIVEWLVEPGDVIGVDQAIAEVSTDKVDTEIPSAVAGTVTELLVEVGDEVAVGAPILALEGDQAEGGSAPAAPSPEAEAVATETAPTPTRPAPSSPESPARATGAPSGATRTPASPAAASGRWSPRVRRLMARHDLGPGEVEGTGAEGRVTPDDVLRATSSRQLSPKVKRLLDEHGLDAATIEGTGAGGRVTPDDVLAAAQRSTDPAARPDTDLAPAAEPEPKPKRVDPPGSRVEKLTRTRTVIAQRMLESLQTTAQLTAAVEADVTRLMQARTQHKDAYRQRYGHSLSPLAFIARATVRTLQRHEVLNASIDTDAGEVIYHDRINLGFAVDAPQGLLVPNIPDAQDLTVAGMQRRIADLAARARDKKLTADEMRGGTFTITNTGSRGSLFDTPILNPPEVGILATPTIEKRPVVVEDEHGNETFAVRQRTYLCLTYDHRLVDGADAARFLSDLAADLDATDWDHEVAELA